MRGPILLEDIVKDLEDQLEQLKNPQRSGAGNIKGFYYLAPGDYDLYFSSNARIKKFLVTLNHAEADRYQILNINWFLAHTSQPLLNTSGVFVAQDAQQLPPSLGKTEWLIAFRNLSFPPEGGSSTTYDCWVKFLYAGTTDISSVVIAPA